MAPAPGHAPSSGLQHRSSALDSPKSSRPHSLDLMFNSFRSQLPYDKCTGAIARWFFGKLFSLTHDSLDLQMIVELSPFLVSSLTLSIYTCYSPLTIFFPLTTFACRGRCFPRPTLSVTVSSELRDSFASQILV